MQENLEEMEILEGRMVNDGGCSLNPPINTTVSGQPEPFQDILEIRKTGNILALD